MNEKEITLSFDLEQVCNDILTKCNQISKTVRDEALEDIRSDVQTPDDPETRSIINRAITEAFGDLKVACQRYLKTGRTTDNNLLERIVTGVTYVVEDRQVQVLDDENRAVYTCEVSGVPTDVYKDGDDWKSEATDEVVTPDETPVPKTETRQVTTDEVDTITYETVTMILYIQNFNVSVTAALESNCHRYLVQYALSEFLSDELAEKGAEYRAKADSTYAKVLKNLLARDRFNMRKPTWI